MKIAFGCDPNASDLKIKLMAFVEGLGHEVADLGSDDPIYANVAFDVAKAVAAGEYDRGILLCGTGIGVSIAANKVKGAYAACVHDVYQAQRAELSNHANIITMTPNCFFMSIFACYADCIGRSGRSGQIDSGPKA